MTFSLIFIFPSLVGDAGSFLSLSLGYTLKALASFFLSSTTQCISMLILQSPPDKNKAYARI
jgi:hypothetical protein